MMLHLNNSQTLTLCVVRNVDRFFFYPLVQVRVDVFWRCPQVKNNNYISDEGLINAVFFVDSTVIKNSLK